MSRQRQPDPKGTVIAGRFRVEGPLGQGGMAHVVRATDLATKRPIALKLLKPEIAKDEQAVARLRREGEVLSKLDHPAIVGIETFGKLDDGRIFIAMELLKGETLGERIRRERKLSVEDLSLVVTGAAAGLSAAHRNDVIHRDLKPDNIFLVGEPMQVKLLDFGISKVFGLAKLTRTGQILGTPRYMAPEQLAADDDVDQRIDVYAMGVILYEALAGTPPFGGANASELVVAIIRGRPPSLRTYCPDIDPALEAVVMRAISRSREARYNSALELAEAWMSVVDPRPKKSSQRGALATSFFGGMEAVEFPEATAGPSQQAPPSEERLRAGTFPEMKEQKPIFPPASGGWTAAVEPSVGHVLPSEPAPETQRAKPFAAPAKPNESPRFEPARLEAAVQQALPHSGAYAPVVPTRPTWLLVLAALIGGALTAGITLWFLNSGDVNPPETAPAPETQLPLGNVEPAAPEQPEDELTDSELEPVIAPDPAPAEVEEPEAPRMSATMRRRRPEAPAEATAPRTTGAILSDARQALSVGNTGACLQFLDEMGSRRTAAALKLEGDCHQRAGDLRQALRTYTRYCSVFPNGPAVDEVRGRVVGGGGTCP
ncbi:MAG: serine/threonine protein kinase [Polyangiales bacterium]|jgi:serine/threonine protein kinase